MSGAKVPSGSLYLYFMNHLDVFDAMRQSNWLWPSPAVHAIPFGNRGVWNFRPVLTTNNKNGRLRD